MKNLVIAILIVAGLAAIGWLTFDFSGKNPSVEIQTDKIESDAETAIDAGKQIIHDTGETLEKVGEDDLNR